MANFETSFKKHRISFVNGFLFIYKNYEKSYSFLEYVLRALNIGSPQFIEANTVGLGLGVSQLEVFEILIEVDGSTELPNPNMQSGLNQVDLIRSSKPTIGVSSN